MVGLLIAGWSAASSAEAEPLPWKAQLAAQSKVSYRGVVNLDAAGSQQNPMMYVAPGGLIGLLAAVATHGVITNSTRNSEKTRLQEEADAVLRPYQEILNRLDDQTLLDRAVAKVNFSNSPDGAISQGGWLVESVPVFSMTQDQSALILDNLLVVKPAQGSSAPLFESTVRVISKPVEQDPAQPFWTANEGQSLQQTLSQLLAESLEIALKQAAGSSATATNTPKSVRFDEGRRSRIERAQVLETSCDRWLIKNLRGWLISVPVRPMPDTGTCTTS